MNSKTLFGEYATQIIDSFVVDDIGIDLIKLGNKEFDKSITVDFKKPILIDEETIKIEFATVIEFIEYQCRPAYIHTKPIWFRINVVDQALNDYIGIGFLDTEQNWVSFTVNYLRCDRADQGGDSILVIFDRNFTWASSLTLSQDDKELRVELYKK
jgi:hypothetical protein